MSNLRYLLVALFVMFGAITPAKAAHIQEIKTSGGIKVWLVEDHKLPLISLHFAFRGGVEQDTPAKQGLATLSMQILTEGAGPYDAAAFQQQLSDHSIEMKFAAGRDSLNGSMKTLSVDRQQAFDLLAMALTQPRADAKDFERERDQQLTAIRSQFANPDWQARYGLFQKIFPNHPYGLRRLGTIKSVSSLSREDIKSFISGHLAQDNLVVAVAGDITSADLRKIIDESFGKLPRHAHLVNVGEISWPAEQAVVLTPREGTQTELLFAMPGPKESDPDFDAAEVANYILGGGGFSSRLMQDVRDKKGLTYGINMGLSPAEHGGVIVGQAATDNPKTREAWDIVQSTMRHFYEDGVTDKEIMSAKDYLTGSIPLALTSTDRIAEKMVELQLNHRPIDYLNEQGEHIRKLTNDEIDAAIHRWFNPDRIVLSMVGKPEGIAPTETRSLVRE